jgi:uncharacterized membrane protein YeiH
MSIMYFLSMAGVAVFAVSGVLSAGRKNFDVFGALVIAIVTAIGGGTLRDLLLDRPMFWIEDVNYLRVTTVAGIATQFYVRYHRPPMKALLIADAFGLALFTLSGAQIAESTGASPGIVILMGCMTGVAGGVLRDILSAEIPLLLRNQELYATAAIAGVGVYLLLLQWRGMDRDTAALIGMATVAVLRLAAIVWKVRIPLFKFKHAEESR